MAVNKNKTKSKIQKQKTVGVWSAIKNFWKNYANFNGTAQRGECFFAFLFVFAVFLVIYELPLIEIYKYCFGSLSVYTLAMLLRVEAWSRILWVVATFIPCISLAERRVRDAGFRAGWVWVPGLILWLWGGIFTDTAHFYFLIFGIIISLLPNKSKK